MHDRLRDLDVLKDIRKRIELPLTRLRRFRTRRTAPGANDAEPAPRRRGEWVRAPARGEREGTGRTGAARGSRHCPASTRL